MRFQSEHRKVSATFARAPSRLPRRTPDEEKRGKSDDTIFTVTEGIDENVHVPKQVRRAAALAEARETGKPLAPPPEAKRAKREPKLPYTDAEIDDALQYMDSGDLKVTDLRVATILGLLGKAHA